MKEYVSKSSKPEIVELVRLANKIKESYFSKDYSECIKISREFFYNYELLNFGKTKFVVPSPKNKYFNELEMYFSKKFKSSSRVKFVEYDGARSRSFLNNDNWYPESAQHTVNLIEWLIYDSGYIAEDNLDEQLREERDVFFKDTSTILFPKENMKDYSDEAKLVYRNAYRYEFLIHGIKIYTDDYSSIHYDMYIPLILGRMCIEQFIKINFVKKYVGEDKDKYKTAADRLTAISQKKIIPINLEKDCRLVLKRGNCNTHNSEASFPFALMHILKTIKRVLDLLK